MPEETHGRDNTLPTSFIEGQLDAIDTGQIPPTPSLPALPSGELLEAGSVEGEEDVLAQQGKSILEMESGLPEKSGRKKRAWTTLIVAGSSVACLATTTILLITGTIQKWLGGANAEFFRQQQNIRNQGEDITQDLVREAQKDGIDFSEEFEMKEAKQEGVDFVERTYQDMSRLFDKNNIASKVEPAVVKLIIQSPLAFETNANQKTDFNLIFNQQNWSIAQKLYMESLAIAAQEKGINPNNGGLEQWLVANKKDSVYSLEVEGQTVNISGAHLLQILWNEYKNADNLPISAQDQQLLLQYWKARGTEWITSGGKIEQKHKLSWNDVQQIFDMAEKTGARPEEVLGNVFTLREEVVSSPGSGEIKALDMAQATMGVASVDNITGAIMGLMVVFGLGRPRLSGLMNMAEANINQALQNVTKEGQRLLEKIRMRPEISEEHRRSENSRRLVNRLEHGLSLSREAVMDLGAILLDPNNQDMRDLILTEGANWFRYVPENHQEIKQIMSFFNCRNYQELQTLAKHPALISPRLKQLLTLKIKEYKEKGRGRERGMKLKVTKILPEKLAQLVELYRSSAGK